MNAIEEAVKKSGFKSLQEMTRMVASVNLTSPGAMEAFEDWKNNDGSKKGLENLLNKKPVADSEAIALWLEGLSRHPACPKERRHWYEGVASDIRNGAYKNR